MAQKIPIIIADLELALASSVSVGQTTASLSSNIDSDGATLPDGFYAFTLDRSSRSRKEHITCTKTGANLTNIKSISRNGTETTGFTKKHDISSSVIISDYMSLSEIAKQLRGVSTLDGSSPLKYDAEVTTYTDRKQLATVGNLQDTAISGAPNASSTTKGIAKLSTNPADSNNPIAVGDNDTRIPTQAENDALAGTSGTPSGTNRYVTNDDTGTSGANKVLRLDNAGKLPALNGENLTNLPFINGNKIYTSTTEVSNTSSSAAIIFSGTLTANTLATGKVLSGLLHIRGFGSAGGVSSVRFVLGGTTLFTVPVQVNSNTIFGAEFRYQIAYKTNTSVSLFVERFDSASNQSTGSWQNMSIYGGYLYEVGLACPNLTSNQSLLVDIPASSFGLATHISSYLESK